MRTKIYIGAAVLLGASMFVGGALGPLGGTPGEVSSPVNPIATEAVLAPAMAEDTDERIAALQARVAEAPNDPAGHTQLALAFLQAAREQADPAFLPKAESALERSLALKPKGNFEAYVAKAALANARHDFSGSVAWSRKAIDVNPYNASPYGLLGDALFELGRVREADAAYQEMVERRPDVASYVRASYALQYRGDTEAAIRAMELALDAAGPSGETAAWVRHQMGDIYAGINNLSEAARHNRIGTQIAPGYVPPTVGVAESLIARGRLAEATAIFEDAAASLPSLEYMIALGDLYSATGREADARAQYERVAKKLVAYRESGVLPDADFIVFYADHELRPEAALGEAFDIYRNRQTQKTADALAWMLHSVGRSREAFRYAQQALKGPGDAATSFHAGAIARALGRSDEAARLLRQALRLDPTFSLVHAPQARLALQRLSS